MPFENEKRRLGKYDHLKLPEVNTILGFNTVFRGNFVVEGPMRIDGKFEGDIKSLDIVIIGSDGVIKGDIYGSTVIVGGKIRGNIFGLNEIILLSTADIVGNLNSQKMVIDDGASFKGRFKKFSENEMLQIFDQVVKTYIEKEKKEWSI